MTNDDETRAVELRPFTRETYAAAFRLKVKPEQERFVATTIGSLAQAYFHEEARPLGVYAGDTLVGFAMLSVEEVDQGVLWLWRFLIGADHQRRGHGRRAIQALVEHARAMDGVREFKLSHVDEVEGNPGPFYEALGFRYTGEVSDGEKVMVLPLQPGDG